MNHFQALVILAMDTMQGLRTNQCVFKRREH
jgi:hypothetical protein